LSRFFVTGGAGFIGSHMVHRLLQRPTVQVTVFDNFTSGRRWHLESVGEADRLQIIRGDLKDSGSLTKAMAGAEVVFHFASNPDIAKAIRQPDIDFWEGTLLTQNVLEGIRVNQVPCLIYASGSGIYGDLGHTNVPEDHGPLLPVSTYGASKLACEVLISAYCHMFDMHAVAFRFANVVGPRQTHGVAYDFVLRLLRDPKQLQILGDGTQSKSYIHVEDVLDAMLMIHDQGWRGFEYFNVATQDAVTVREIAELVVQRLGLTGVDYRFTGGDRGWKGDVPVVRLNTEKIRARGWTNRRTSREALIASIDAIIADAKTGRFPIGA
jgi:UDP-glucose 4-epimerase